MNFDGRLIFYRCKGRLIMETSITITEKKEFLRWFLNQYQLKKRESVWILNYLLSQDVLVKKLRFVEFVQYCPRGIYMSTHCSEAASFRFYKQNIMTTDPEKALHDLRLHREEEIYIQLNFRDSFQCPNYLAVLEDNPYIPKHLLENEHDGIQAEEFLQYVSVSYERARLKKEIDLALDENDKEKFQKLTEALKLL